MSAYLQVSAGICGHFRQVFPTKAETAKVVVVKDLLEDILPRYGLPHTTGSDSGLAFVSKVSQVRV